MIGAHDRRHRPGTMPIETDLHERETLPTPAATDDPHERETMPNDERETLPSSGDRMRAFDTAAEGFFVMGEVKSAIHREEAAADARAAVAAERRRAHTKWVMAVMAGCAAVLALAGAHLG